MLRVSKLTDYGTLVMACLARDPNHIYKAREIADTTGVSLPTVSKLLKGLARESLLVSFQGAHGGYSLARRPEDISVAQIISALEGGPIGLTECSSSPGLCEQESHCSIRGNWQRINQVIREALDQVSLEEIAGPPGKVNVTIPSPGSRIAG